MWGGNELTLVLVPKIVSNPVSVAGLNPPAFSSTPVPKKLVPSIEPINSYLIPVWEKLCSAKIAFVLGSIAIALPV